MSTPTILLILIAIFLLLAGTAIFLYLVIRRSHKISFAVDPAAKVEPEKKESDGSEFLQYTSDVELRTSFRRALRTLKTYVTVRDYRYRAPWYLLAGESKSGKTSLLDSNGLDIPVNELIEKNRRLNWYLFDQGVVIDVAGDFVLRNDGSANHRGWNTIMRLLQKHRPQCPLDGLVLTIPATDLFADGELDHERRLKLEQKAQCLYKKLWQAQKILGMRLPVYIIITKCDEITGFTSFCRQLPEKLHTQMFGWSNSATIETAYKPELLTEAFESLHKHLSWLQFEIYAERDEIQDVDDLFLFPPAIQSLCEPLSVYLECLFKQSAYHESYLFRGLYFCGEANIEAVPETAILPERTIQSVEQLEPLQTAAALTVERKPIFLTDLFRKKIFTESTLAQPIRRIALSRNRTALAAQVLSLLIVLFGGVGLAFSYNRLAKQEDELYRFLSEEENDLKTIEGYRVDRKRAGNLLTDEWLNRREQLLESGETRLLTGMANMNARRFGSLFIPSSWFSNVNQRLETSIGAVFKYVIFESLRMDMQQRAKNLLSAHPDHPASEIAAGEDDPTAAEESAAGATHVNPDFQLSFYVEELGDFRINLERYNSLVGKDPDSLNTLRQLVTYLDHAPLPANFDKNNYLYQQALFTAQGREIDSARFYKESANRVGDLIEDFYGASFNQKGVTYDHLNDIAQTEALLSRPEYTWLSTFVFDPHSPFHGMTLSTGLGELRKALQDLRREEFMSREPADYESSLLLPPEQPRYQHFVRRVLVWDQDTLRRAITLYDQYERFVETKNYERSEYLDVSVKQAARTRLKTKMTRLFREARIYQGVSPVTDGSALRASLIAEIKSLQEAQPTLAHALQVAAGLGIDNELRGALSGQIAYLLRGVYREFVTQQFYSMKRGDFSWWNGSQPTSFVAYDLNSLEDLNGYLALQRQNIAFLARELAAPLLTFSASQSIYPQSDVSFNWNEILTDLDAFDNKLPGNPISSLESFILTDMDRVSVDSCLSTLKLTNDSRDYFLRIRNSMRAQFYRRCNDLARIKAVNDTLAALENYREIEQAFNKSLAGGFPFTDLSTRPNYPDLDPWEMVKFFRLFDSKEKAARLALVRSADFGAAPQGSIEFLDQVAVLREFFAPFLEKKQGPMYDFRVQFRVNREQEIGANQIIDWKFEVGKKKFAYLSDDLEGRWIFGDPVRLTLRWASDSPVLPVTGATPASVKAKDRIAVFEYNDHWSLFSLLLKHGFMLKRAGTTAECDQGFDSEPYTLKFTVRTDPDPAGQPAQRADLKTSNAEVFMRISLVTANKQEPVTLPCFPKKAPPVPALPVVIQKGVSE